VAYSRQSSHGTAFGTMAMDDIKGAAPGQIGSQAFDRQQIARMRSAAHIDSGMLQSRSRSYFIYFICKSLLDPSSRVNDMNFMSPIG
jgi:hypothetical protein